MEKIIKIAELLKDCPKDMELDCAMYEDVYFDYVDEFNIIHCYIQHETHKTSIVYNPYGTPDSEKKSKCVLFPKGKTTWEGFVPPCKFKDGDILATDLGSVFFLNKRLNTDEYYGCYVGIGGDGSFHICNPFAYKECCGLATEEEKQKLFDAIKANGYHWNAETKTLETLATNKFDISTLKPFESKVLIRVGEDCFWKPAIFGFYDKINFYVLGGTAWSQCVPYKDNEHLLGTTDACDEFYKTW